jgi:hypothetical protein
MARGFEKLYLGYLLFAPIGATVMATITYDGPADIVLGLLWITGVAAVAVYAAFVASYLVAPKAGWRALLAIVDGPLWIAIAALTLRGWELLDLATWFFVAESLGIYLAIALVAIRKLRGDALASVGIMVACIGVVCFACGWALFPKLAGDPRGALMFAAAIAQSTVASYWITDRDETVRSTDASATVILVSVGMFHVAIGLGALLRFVILR